MCLIVNVLSIGSVGWQDNVRDGVIKALKPPHSLEDAIVLRDAISDYAKDHMVRSSKFM